MDVARSCRTGSVARGSVAALAAGGAAWAAPFQAVASEMRVFRRFAVAFQCVSAIWPKSASLVAGIVAWWQRRWSIEFFSIKLPAQMQHLRPCLSNGSIAAILMNGEPELF